MIKTANRIAGTAHIDEFRIVQLDEGMSVRFFVKAMRGGEVAYLSPYGTYAEAYAWVNAQIAALNA